MRSRFSAYATKAGQYIFDTYGAQPQLSQSVTEIQAWADECLWLALAVHNTTESTVEFSAYYVVDNTLCELREKSNFTLEQGRWRYIDGDITVHNEITNIKRNEICPCNSYPTAWSAKKGKKFKHCCIKLKEDVYRVIAKMQVAKTKILKRVHSYELTRTERVST